MGSQLLSLIPQDCFDVHVLRTLKQHIARLLTRPEIQQTSNNAREYIPEIIYALNMTFQDVEESWRVWRHERVRTVLQSGFVYIRNRITSARWRRNQGRSPAAFQGVYQPFRYVGTGKINPNQDDQPWGWPPSNNTGPVAQASVYHQPETYDTVPSASFSDVHHVQITQLYPLTNVPGRHGGHHAAQAGTSIGHDYHSTHYQQYQPFTSPQAAIAGTPEYRPPLGPPPNWQPPRQQQQQQQQQPTLPHTGAATPAPSSPLLSPEVATAVEVATRYLEAVNKAVNVCIELNAI